jgi:hypothetical protein
MKPFHIVVLLLCAVVLFIVWHAHLFVRGSTVIIGIFLIAPPLWWLVSQRR